jgi:nucleoside-diphosphate-sugar epimerase
MMFEQSVTVDLEHVLVCTRELWEDLQGKEILLTGGTGFFGRWLVNSFLFANQSLDLNAKITVLSRDPEKFLSKYPHLRNNASLSFIQGDVRDFSSPGQHFSHIIHAATESSTRLNWDNPIEMLDSIVIGTRHVLQFAQKNPVEKFLYVSSGAVYGRQPPELPNISETYLGGPDYLNPYSAYAEGKRAAELLCVMHKSLNIKIARCFAFVGPFQSYDVHFAIGDFITDAMAGRPIVVGGDGSPYRSYLYGADLAVWLWTILFAGRVGEAYNVGSPEEIQISELARLVARKVAPVPPVSILKNHDPAVPCERYVPDVTKAQRELGLQVRVPLELAIEKTITWIKGY